jgi:hypothetical protein
MPRWQHGINEKVAINLDHGGSRHVMCAWDDCEKDGHINYMCAVNYGADDGPNAHIVKHIFCTERHRQYWINSTRQYGRLPPGLAHLL